MSTKQNKPTSTGPKALKNNKNTPGKTARATVYALICHVTGRKYYGSVFGYAPGRMANHFSKLRNGKHPCKALQQDFIDFGNVEAQLIVSSDILSPLDVVMIEMALIANDPTSYNKCKTGKPVSPEHRARIGEANRKIDSAKIYRAQTFLSAGFSIAETVEATGLSRSTVYKIKNGDFRVGNN